MRSFSETGQSSIEAAFLLPVLFAVLAMLLQPAILLYNHCVMNAAASEGCRLLATCASNDASVRAYVERRLASIPRLAIFHEGDEWEIDWDQETGNGAIEITNHAEPLPLFGVTAGLLGNLDASGKIVQRVRIACSPLPKWIENQGYSPSSWIGAWK